MSRVTLYKSKIVGHVQTLRKTKLPKSPPYLNGALGVPPCDREDLSFVARNRESVGLPYRLVPTGLSRSQDRAFFRSADFLMALASRRQDSCQLTGFSLAE